MSCAKLIPWEGSYLSKWSIYQNFRRIELFKYIISPVAYAAQFILLSHLVPPAAVNKDTSSGSSDGFDATFCI
jgi:hypothetical protein